MGITYRRRGDRQLKGGLFTRVFSPEGKGRSTVRGEGLVRAERRSKEKYRISKSQGICLKIESSSIDEAIAWVEVEGCIRLLFHFMPEKNCGHGGDGEERKRGQTSSSLRIPDRQDGRKKNRSPATRDAINTREDFLKGKASPGGRAQNNIGFLKVSRMRRAKRRGREKKIRKGVSSQGSIRSGVDAGVINAPTDYNCFHLPS